MKSIIKLLKLLESIQSIQMHHAHFTWQYPCQHLHLIRRFLHFFSTIRVPRRQPRVVVAFMFHKQQGRLYWLCIEMMMKEEIHKFHLLCKVRDASGRLKPHFIPSSSLSSDSSFTKSHVKRETFTCCVIIHREREIREWKLSIEI